MGAAALAAVALTASPAVNAQENGNRDSFGNIVRGPYETNMFGDNWFIASGGGVNLFLNDSYTANVGLSLDASVGKWFTPSVGMRAGYSGISTNYWSDTPSVLGRTIDQEQQQYQQKFGYMYFHGDFLWNISNAIGGYKETRFWDFVPYLHAGYFRSYGLDKADFANNEIAAGAGLLHNLRLTERLGVAIDMKAIVVNGRAAGADGVSLIPSVTVGMSVNLGWPGFVRSTTVIGAVETADVDQMVALEAAAVALELANANLEEENSKLQNANAGLTDQLNTLKKAYAGKTDLIKGLSPAVVYFNIGKAVLSVDEMRHLDYIVNNILTKADPQAKVHILVMGSADSNTGTAKRNQNLSEARGNYIADLLATKYGISKERLVVKSEVVQAKADPELDRAVILSF
jgi:outer membrane protein OmpA-like peptidoglycan-associated protein